MHFQLLMMTSLILLVKHYAAVKGFVEVSHGERDEISPSKSDLGTCSVTKGEKGYW